MIRVIVAGGTGRTGREVTRYLIRQPNIKVAAVLSRRHAGKTMDQFLGKTPYQVPIFRQLPEGGELAKPDVLVDFTNPRVGKLHFYQCLERGIHPVIGTTGFQAEEIAEFASRCQKQGLGGALIANFSLGALVMFRAIHLAAQVFEDVSVIDGYPPSKQEKPSGTSKRIVDELKRFDAYKRRDIPTFSLRMVGLNPHQQVIFASPGEKMSIVHDVSNRACFGPGVAKAVSNIHRFKHLVTDMYEFFDAENDGS